MVWCDTLRREKCKRLPSTRQLSLLKDSVIAEVRSGGLLLKDSW